MSKSSINTPKLDKKLVWASIVLAAIVGLAVILSSQASTPPKDQKNGQGLRAAMVHASAKSYPSGQTVTFSLTNRSGKVFYLNNSAPWRIVNRYDQSIFTPISTQAVTELGPGQTRSWNWDQKDNNGKQVPIGPYRVSFERYGTTTFDITDPITKVIFVKYTNNGFEPNKPLANVGDQVTFTNNSTRQMQLASDPHPTHKNCPELNTSVIAPGKSATITAKSGCGFHNHLFPNHTGSLLVNVKTAP